MKIVINKLFGKFNTEIEIDKKLNILVGENGIGKSTILRICNLIINNNYAELTKYYFDNIKINDNNNQITEISYSELFPTKNDICEKLDIHYNCLCYDPEYDKAIELIDNLDNNDLLNEFMVYCYFDSNLSVKLDRCLDKYAHNRTEQIKTIKDILRDLYNENSNEIIKSFVYFDETTKINKSCYSIDFVENYKIENNLYKESNIINSYNENDEKDFDAERFIYDGNDYLYGEYTGKRLDRLYTELHNEEDDYNYEIEKDDPNFNEYDYNIDDLDNSDYEDLYSKTEKDDLELEKERYIDDKIDFEYDDDNDMFNIYEMKEFLDERDKNVLRIEKYKFKDIKKEYLDIKKVLVNQLIDKKKININKIISNLYYDEKFIKNIYSKIDEYGEKYKNYFLAKKYNFALNVNAYNPTDEEIRNIKDFYKNEKNRDIIKNYILPLMPKDSPYEFFINKAYKRITDSDNYMLFRLYEIYNCIIKDIEEYRNEKLKKLEELLNKYIRSKEIKIKPTGICIYDKEIDKNDNILKTNFEKIIELNSLSAGEKKIIILLTLGMFIDNSIFIIDEIENSLSIIWQEEIIRDLTEINENNNLIIATQSAYALKDENIQRDILFLPYEEV